VHFVHCCKAKIVEIVQVYSYKLELIPFYRVHRTQLVGTVVSPFIQFVEGGVQSLELGMVIIDMSTICKFLFLFILSHF